MQKDTSLITDSLVPSCIKSLENTFTSMVMLPVVVGELQEKANGHPRGCISGSIGISGRHTTSGSELRAQLALIFPESLAFRIFRGMMMMGETDPVEQHELNDVVGELSNMTAGGAKTLLSEHGFDLSISLPTVAVGPDHYLSTPAGSNVSIVIPIHVENEFFYVEISANVG